MTALTPQNRDQAVALFKHLQDRLGAAFEAVDGTARFERKDWQRAEGGGGTIGLIRGPVVEKAGANVSSVHGTYPNMEKEHAGKPFFAAGVSTITHMMNPYAPIGHMNVRILDVGDTFWVGGGADLTPFKPFVEDTRQFHAALERACEAFDPGSYETYRKWCDEYFYIPHRQSARGVGGVFFDDLKGDFPRLLGFLEAIGSAYVDTFTAILQRRKETLYTPEDKDGQLYWRGRYAEFNLAWDRGTRFGLMTGGNTEAIFVSLPPVVKW